MFDQVNEKIECKAHFKDGTIIPVHIKWKKNWYQLQKVLLRWEERKGRELLRHFSVTDGGNVFHITFYPESLHWKLHGIDKDGQS